MVGSLVLNGSIQSAGQTTIKTDIPAGIYVVVVTSEEDKTQKKVYLK